MEKTEKEITEKNIELSAEFSRYLFDHPDLEESIPKGSDIILLPEYDNELKNHNLELGKKFESDGIQVVYIKIENIKPKILSRIEGVTVELKASG